MKISMTTITVAAALFAAPALVSAATIVGLTTGNRLVSFDSASPGVILADVAISGLALNHSLIGIDFRPADGVLVGVSRSSASDDAQVYTINTFTGGATAIGLLFALPGSSGFGVDFNPVPGALRLVTDAEANRRITMGGAGVVNTDASLNPAPTAGLQISGAAYSNNVPGGVGGNTTLYVVDSTSGNLYSQGSVNFPGGGATSPNTGTLFLIGSLGLGTNLSTQIGLDISDLGLAFLSIADGNGDRLYTFNPATGAASLIGDIGSSNLTIDIAVTPTPEPAAFALTALGFGLMAYRHFRRR